MNEWIAIIESFLLLIFTIFLLWRYAKKGTPWYVLLLVFFGWYLSFLIIIVLPLDIYDSNVNESPVVIKFTAVWWPLCYWMISVLGWILNSFVMTYSYSGYFTVKDKLKHSLKLNLKYYSILAAISVVFILLIYFFLSAKN